MKINNNADIANMFNNYFTNIGPGLLNDIMVQTSASIYDYLENKNNQNLFLTPVSEKEGIRIVYTWESKICTYLRFANFSLYGTIP